MAQARLKFPSCSTRELLSRMPQVRVLPGAPRSTKGIDDDHRSNRSQSARDAGQTGDTRAPVELLLRKLSAGTSKADLLEAYPGLTREDIHAAMRYAADTLAHEQVVFVDKDQDFGVLAYAGGDETAGVILIRFPADASRSLDATVVRIFAEFGDRLSNAFTVIGPGRARLPRTV